MRIIIREVAYDDLDRIYSWIAKDRPHSADLVIERIFENVERLGRFPYMGHIGRVSGTHEWAVPGLPYIVVYTIDRGAGEVAIVGVFHGAQDREKE